MHTEWRSGASSFTPLGQAPREDSQLEYSLIGDLMHHRRRICGSSSEKKENANTNHSLLTT